MGSNGAQRRTADAMVAASAQRETADRLAALVDAAERQADALETIEAALTDGVAAGDAVPDDATTARGDHP